MTEGRFCVIRPTGGWSRNRRGPFDRLCGGGSDGNGLLLRLAGFLWGSGFQGDGIGQLDGLDMEGDRQGDKGGILPLCLHLQLENAFRAALPVDALGKGIGGGEHGKIRVLMEKEDDGVPRQGKDGAADLLIPVQQGDGGAFLRLQPVKNGGKFPKAQFQQQLGIVVKLLGVEDHADKGAPCPLGDGDQRIPRLVGESGFPADDRLVVLLIPGPEHPVGVGKGALAGQVSSRH